MATAQQNSPLPTAWIGRDGLPLTCAEKNRILNENLAEIRELCQRVLDDAVQMGCSEHFVRIVLTEMIASMERSSSRLTNAA